MKLLVLGATGGTGKEIVGQALAQGDEVTAFVRDAGKLALSHERLRVVIGDLLRDGRKLRDALAGQDAVASALGVGKSFRSSGLMTNAMAALLPEMERAGVRRLVLVSAFGVGESIRDVPLVPRIGQKLLLREVFADKRKADDMVRSSSLEWTIVQPSVLIDKPGVGPYRSGERLTLRGVPGIGRAEVADFVLRQARSREYLRKTVLVSR
jgi:putative NADH-flavin reductase